MIGSIRKHIQKRGAKIILWLTLFSLAGGSFFSILQFSRRFKNVEALAVVNDYDIGILEYRRKFLSIAHVIQEIRKLYGPKAESILALWGLSENPQKSVLEGLIQDKALLSAANSISSHVSKDYISSKLRDPLFIREYLQDIVPPQALSGDTLNVELLRSILERIGMSEVDFEEAAREAVQKHLFNRLIESTVYVTNDELKHAYIKDNVRRKYGIVHLQESDYLKKARSKKATEAQLQGFYKQHMDDLYWVPEKRSARVWTFVYDAPVSDKEAQSFYDEHKRMYVSKPEEWVVQKLVLKVQESNKLEKRRQAQELMKQAKERPERFQELAQTYSESSDKGKLLTLGRAQMDQSVVTAIAGLAKGSISHVIETDEGFVIYKLIDKKYSEYTPFDKVKDEIKQRLKREKFSRDFETNAQRVISQAHDMPEVFKRFIEEKQAKESKLTDVVDAQSQIASALFGLTRVGDKSFYVEDGKGYIIELTDSKKAYATPFEQIKDKVAEDFYKEQARELALVDLRKFQGEVSKFGALAQELGGTYKVTDWVDPKQDATLKELKSCPGVDALSLTRVNEMAINTYCLVVVTAVDTVHEADFVKKAPQLKLSVMQGLLQRVGKNLVDYLRSTAHVTVNEDLVQRASSRV